MKLPYISINKKTFCLLFLLFLPLSGFAASGINFFSPPETDISLQVMRAIFGAGNDSLNGKLIRPVLLVLCSGMVVFMGAIFAWNITKFVLHTAQQGEMMVGKGKELGLVVLRSVVGMGMVLPIYSGAYKGLCLAIIFVAWLITQGIGLADRGVNSVVDYLTAGGTIYQMAQSSKDVSAKQDMATPALSILAAESCMYRLRQIKDAQDKAKQDTNDSLNDIGLTPDSSTTISSQLAINYDFDPKKPRVVFGTKNTAYPTKGDPYFGECGTVSWSLGDAKADSSEKAIRNLAVQKMIVDLEPLAKRIALMDPNQPSNTVNNLVASEVTNAIINYVNLIAPLRTKVGVQLSQDNYDKLQTMKNKGWMVLGAYYPMMGDLNRQEKAALSGFQPTATEGALASAQTPSNADSAYNVADLTDNQKILIRDQFKYTIGAQRTADVRAFILILETASANTIQELLRLQSPEGTAAEPLGGYLSWLNDAKKALGHEPANIPENGASEGTDWLKNQTGYIGNYLNPALDWAGGAGNTITNFLNQTGISSTLSGLFYDNGKNTGESFSGLLDRGRLQNSAAMVGLFAITGGPVAWATIPPMLVIFVDIVSEFRNTIDQTQNPDPLLAIQKFGFYVLDKAMLLVLIVFGGSFIASFFFGWIPSSNPVGGLGVSAAMETPLISMFFAAFAALGVGCGIYLPMIPFVVWISAILGWIGHSFQAIVGAPLVALRMTTAEGEGVLGGAVEGVMMLLGVLLTPFLLVMGLTGSLILIKQLMIVINYLFSLFAGYSFGPHSSSFAWIAIGVPAILFIYFTLMVTVVQSVCTKLIGEMPGEVLRHLHSAMTGHKAAEQIGQKMEGATDKLGSQSGDYATKKSYSAPGGIGIGQGKGKEK